MIKNSKNCVFYVGAGMSTSAGVNDYASKKKIIEVGNRL
jgi:NAD-dependent SIR2 family protein deacetylase